MFLIFSNIFFMLHFFTLYMLFTYRIHQVTKNGGKFDKKQSSIHALKSVYICYCYICNNLYVYT